MICQDDVFHVSTITPIDFHILFFNCLSACNTSILDGLSVMKLQKFITNTDCLDLTLCARSLYYVCFFFIYLSACNSFILEDWSVMKVLKLFNNIGYWSKFDSICHDFMLRSR